MNNIKNKTTLNTKINVLKAANISKNFVAAFTKVFNNSYEQSIFSSSLKTAKVVPIYQEGPKTTAANYRPILLWLHSQKFMKNLCIVELLTFRMSILLCMKISIGPC